MRFRVTLAVHRRANGGYILPYDYQHAVASMFYDRLIRADSSFKDLHDQVGFKFFTFSQLEIPRRRSLPEGLQILSNDAYLWFSSVEPKLVRVLAGQLLREPDVVIRGVKLRAVRVDLLPSVSFDGGTASFVTMSPVLLRTKRDTDDGIKTWDLSPEEKEFEDALTRNLVRKFKEFHGRPPSGEISVESIPRFRRKRIMIQDTSHRAYLMDIQLRGDPELLSFAYDCGLGEKNSMGFGMVRRG
ncbi:MAG: CRISPR-associated endoribonuclease Cas6 [Candidatus Thorarchaeota archaeon]|nr:MAG: CRISPR-associated endoribonuclease Cas6 [Candidatus Thorarchaeota archaeon]